MPNNVTTPLYHIATNPIPHSAPHCYKSITQPCPIMLQLHYTILLQTQYPTQALSSALLQAHYSTMPNNVTTPLYHIATNPIPHSAPHCYKSITQPCPIMLQLHYTILLQTQYPTQLRTVTSPLLNHAQ